MTALPPRLVVAGTHSGVGKTTVATGLMAAFGHAGHRVGAAKVGPDFIDPGYHSIAVGRPSRNLDIWMSGPRFIAPQAATAGEGSDVLVIEGVMGLFDGAGDGTPSSTADVARLVDAPVILVVDASSMSQSVAALVHGFASHDSRIRIRGVVLNRVGSDGHEDLLRAALAPLGIPVVGVLHRDERLRWRDRHLGLVPIAEGGRDLARSIDRLGALVAERFDLAALRAIATDASTLTADPRPLPRPAERRVRIAVASGPAFSFTYPDNLEALVAAGADVVPVDPLGDDRLPDDVSGLVAGGGFPEVYAEQLAQNAPLLEHVRQRVGQGLVTWAECGGLLWLCRTLNGHPMAGAVPADACMTERLNLGYRTATTDRTTPLGPAGTVLRGHEFHYSATTPTGHLLALTGRHGSGKGGFGHQRLFASYLHLHLGARPDVAEHFVDRCMVALRLPYGG